MITFAFYSVYEIVAEEPKSFRDTVNCQYVNEWKKAIDEEMNSLYKNYIYNMVKRPGNKRIVVCK